MNENTLKQTKTESLKNETLVAFENSQEWFVLNKTSQYYMFQWKEFQ